ncbi:MAG: LacI family DNA-binding transcriptional regulator [Devosia sp.]
MADSGAAGKLGSGPKAQRRRVTMTDVAKAAGCSQATVSFVLNRTAGMKLSQQTRDRVTEAARALGYVSSSFPAQTAGLSAQAHPVDRIVGLAVDQLATSPEAVVAIEGVRQAACIAGNVVLIAQALGDAAIELRTLRALTGAGVYALIYMAIFTREIVAPAYLTELDIPVILLNCYTADNAFPAVVPSEIVGGQVSTRHLIDRGHRRIATITGDPRMEAAQHRLKGYRRALATADIPFDPDLVVEGDWSAGAGYRATVQLMALPDRPTAIFCQNDRTAIGCYKALKETGHSIPHDVSVVGYDDEEMARHMHPPLTTSILPHRAMGMWVVEQLANLPSVSKRYPITKLECPLVERESVATARARPRSAI